MSEIDQLRELLFSEEKKELQTIKQRTESPSSRTRDVAEILPGAIGVSHREDGRLVKALREPVRECFEEAVRSDPRSFADALFPVIGPAIRKSIAETFRGLVQSLNQTMEYSLSPKGIKWRMEAARAGVPLGEYILRKTLVYRIEQVYLIQRERGLMAGHVQNERAVAQDADAVSAMFTAIQDFVSDSFSPDHAQLLETADIGEFTVWVLNGPYSMMACVIRGVPPRGVREELTEILERINLQYGDALRRFDGDASELAGVEELLAECLLLEQRQGQDADAGDKGLISTPLKIVLGVLALALTWWIVSSYLEARRLSDFSKAVADTPGLVATDLKSDGRIIRMRGLADPLAESIEQVLARAGLENVEVEAELAPFQSLDPEIILSRARRSLAPPASVELALTGSTLRATGRAGRGWRDDFEARALLLPGIDAADASATAPSDEDLLRAARAALSPPAGVALRVSQQELEVTGVAPQAWIDQIAGRLAGVEGLEGISTGTLEPMELERLQSLVRQLDGRAFYFESGANLLDARNTALAATSEQLKEVIALARMLGRTLDVRIVGHADGVGGVAVNQALMRRRAETVREGFVEQGLDAARIAIGTADLPGELRIDPAQRKAVLRLSLAGTESP